MTTTYHCLAKSLIAHPSLPLHCILNILFIPCSPFLFYTSTAFQAVVGIERQTSHFFHKLQLSFLRCELIFYVNYKNSLTLRGLTGSNACHQLSLLLKCPLHRLECQACVLFYSNTCFYPSTQRTNIN